MTLLGRHLFSQRYHQLSLALVAMLFALSLGVTDVGLRDYHASSQDIRDLLTEGHEIRYDDEVLTMSARLGGLTGDRAWERRYDAALPRLDQALRRAGDLHPAGRPALQAIATANQRLIDAEREAFARVRAGDLPAAAHLLFGATYEQDQARYAEGLARFTAELEQARQHLEARLQRVFIQTAVLDALLVGLIFALLRRQFQRLAERLRIEQLLGQIARRLMATARPRGDAEIRWALGQVAAQAGAVQGALILTTAAQPATIDRVWCPGPAAADWARDLATWLADRPPDSLLDAPRIARHPDLDAPLKATLAAAGIGALLAVKLLSAGGAQLHIVLGARRRLAWRGSEAPLLLTLLEVLGRALASWANEAQLFQQATTDALTGLFNRRYFLAKLAEELQRVRRHDQHSALLIVDLDHFKAVNDQHGHDAGDAVLCQFARLARAALREIDVMGRLGGEEFGILLPLTNLDPDVSQAWAAAERLRATIAGAVTPTRQGAVWVTISVGLTLLTPADQSTTAPLHRADQALYAAKRHGRNTICGGD